MSTEARIREALTLHQLATTSRERYCLCGFFLGAWAPAATTAAHQADVLAGIATEAQADAWDEGRECSGPYPINPYRTN